MSESDRLIDAYLDNELQDDDRPKLCSWLQQDRAHLDQFIRDCFLHWQLFAIGQRRSLQHGVNDAPKLTGLAKLNSTLPNSALQVTRVSPVRGRHGRRTIFVLAASLLLVCGLGGWAMVRMRQPETVAQLTKTTADAAWVDGSTAPRSGVFLHKGQIVNLRSGRVLATLSSGVQIVVQGPATFRIDAGNELFLQMGRVTVTVPRQASGFILESPMARFVDLGTEYTVNLRSPTSCDLHVFSGLVEMQPSNARRIDQLRVPGGRAISFDDVSGDVETLVYEPGERMTL